MKIVGVDVDTQQLKLQMELLKTISISVVAMIK